MAFDTRDYEWADITVILAGRDVTGLRGIKYSEKREKDLVYGKGAKPLHIQCGNIGYSGEIGLLQSEYEKLRRAMGGSLLKGSFSMVVSYGNPSLGEPMVTDVLTGCQFTEDNTEWKQGDKFQEKNLPILFLDKSTK